MLFMDYKVKLGISVAIIFAVVLSSDSYFQFNFFYQDRTSNRFATNSANTKADSLSAGFFPSLNQAQAVIGSGNGHFNKTLTGGLNNNSNFTVTSNIFRSESSILEALYEGSVDVSYVNPNTLIDGFVLIGNQDFRIVSGVSLSASSFIVRNDSGIQTADDLDGKRFAYSQGKDLQEIALKKFLFDNGFNTSENRRNFIIIALEPSMIISQFENKKIDGAWVSESIITILK
jgi:NitT/TauT family transport system substrate-binding protein